MKKSEVKETWQFIERHGAWWAYKGELPPAAAFQTHGRGPGILGPYPSRVVAEAILKKQRRAPTNGFQLRPMGPHR
jgi:hypothetical protein